MAKPGVAEDPPSKAAKAEKLRRELVQLVQEYGIDMIDDSMSFLMELKELNLSCSLEITEEDAPEELKCPISNKLMSDPVVLVSGVTYDRSSIQKWLDEGNQKCPVTKKVLSHTTLNPNEFVRKKISQWCREHRVSQSTVSDADKNVIDSWIVEGGKRHLLSLLGKMSFPDTSHQTEVVKEISLVTKFQPTYRELFKDSDLVTMLLKPLSQCSLDAHHELQEHLVTSILNISLPVDNKLILVEHPLVIPLLIEYLTSGTMAARSKAAAALNSLSSIESNRILIGESGAVNSLVDLLKEKDAVAKREAATAINTLCLTYDNIGKAIREGAVKVVLDKLCDEYIKEVFFHVLVKLTSIPEGVHAIEPENFGVMFNLLNIIREARTLEVVDACVTIVYQIIRFEVGNQWKELCVDEDDNHTLYGFANSRNRRARTLCNAILEIVKKKKLGLRK